MKIAGYKLTKHGRRVYWASLGVGMIPSMVVVALVVIALPVHGIWSSAAGGILVWLAGATLGSRLARATFDQLEGDQLLLEEVIDRSKR